MTKKLSIISAIYLIISLAACGPYTNENQLHRETAGRPGYDKLSQAEKDYIDRFNAVAKDIRDFPEPGEDIESYFYVFKSVSKLADAEIILIGETHTDAKSQLVSAGAINKLINKDDIVLFEGAEANTKIRGNPGEHFITQIFAVREYERLRAHKGYVKTSISDIENKYLSLYSKTKKFLALDLLKIDDSVGKYWDLLDGNTLHSDHAKRNEAMVDTIKKNLTANNKVFIVAGAGHTPHFEFAKATKSWANTPKQTAAHAAGFWNPKTIGDNFYNFETFSTKVIFDYLKGKKFAVIIPKNMSGADGIKAYFPVNAE